MTIGTSPHFHLETVDVDVIEEAILGMPISVQRLSAAGGGVSLATAALEDVAILAGEFGFPIATTGEPGPDSLVIGMPLEEGSGAWNGVELSPDRAWFYPPGSEHAGSGFMSAAARPPRFATISMPTSVLDMSRSDEFQPAGHWVVTDDRVRHLRNAVNDVLGLAQSKGLTPERAQLARTDVIETAAALFAGPAATRIEMTSANWITRECIALAETLGPMPSPAELAETIGVSDRWIRAAFRRVYGVSASAFFRSQAVQGAYRELRSATPGSTSVTDVAIRWGFWHLGRFSATYRAFVGENPSVTLARAD
jgi:AraC-like DNA-binding protein